MADSACPSVCQLLQVFQPSFRRFHEESSGVVLGKCKLSHQPLGTKINFCWRGWVNLSGYCEQQDRDLMQRRREISKRSDSSISRRLGSREEKDLAEGEP